jgi:hypothetical protein
VLNFDLRREHRSGMEINDLMTKDGHQRRLAETTIRLQFSLLNPTKS